MKLGDYISKYRADHGLSQRQFSAMCDLSNGYISMLERGTNPSTGLPIVPAIDSLIKLCNGMGISLGELFGSVDDMPVDISKKPATDTDSRLAEINSIFSRLSDDNRSKLLELANLFLTAQSKTEESK